MTDHADHRASPAAFAFDACDAARCPDAQTLIAFADGRLEAHERDHVAASVADCGGCAVALRTAIEANEWSDHAALDFTVAIRDGATAPATVGMPHAVSTSALLRRRRRAMWIPMALAASLVLLIGAPLVLRTRPDDADHVLRGAPAVATLPADRALLNEPPARLAWPCSTAPDAASVEVLDASANVIWRGVAMDCAVQLPPETRTRVSTGETLWRVVDAGGATVIGPFSFRIER